MLIDCFVLVAAFPTLPAGYIVGCLLVVFSFLPFSLDSKLTRPLISGSSSVFLPSRRILLMPTSEKKKKQKEEKPAADSDTTHQKVTVQANLRAIAALSFGFGITHHFHSFGHDLENKADYASFCKPAEHEHPWWSKGRDRRYRSCARKATAGMTT